MVSRKQRWDETVESYGKEGFRWRLPRVVGRILATDPGASASIPTLVNKVHGSRNRNGLISFRDLIEVQPLVHSAPFRLSHFPSTCLECTQCISTHRELTMSFTPAPSSFRPPTAATCGSEQQDEQQFKIGTVTPKKIRIATKKPSVEKRSVNYKKGIDSLKNRKLRRTRLDEHRDKDRTRRISQRRLPGENNGLRGNSDANAKGNANNRSSSSSNAKVYSGSAKDKLTQFYTDHNPTKLLDVDTTLKKYANKEDELFAKLAKNYSVDPSVFGPSKSFSTTIFTPSIRSGGAFAAYAATPGMASFGSLATPKRGSSIFGVSSTNNKVSIFGDSNYNKITKGRTTITSLRTYSDGCRGLDNGDYDICDSDDMMECD